MRRAGLYVAAFVLASALGRWLWWCGYTRGYGDASIHSLGSMMRAFRRYAP